MQLCQISNVFFWMTNESKAGQHINIILPRRSESREENINTTAFVEDKYKLCGVFDFKSEKYVQLYTK